MTYSSLKGNLQELITAKRRKAFIAYEKGSDTQALGLLAAEYCNWSAPAIYDVITTILEDSNFHSLNEQWQKLIEPKKKQS